MSISANGIMIACDGVYCSAKARIPVGLRRTLHEGTDNQSDVSGWLYVTRDNVVRHFCANCKCQYLSAQNVLTQPDRISNVEDA